VVNDGVEEFLRKGFHGRSEIRCRDGRGRCDVKLSNPIWSILSTLETVRSGKGHSHPPAKPPQRATVQARRGHAASVKSSGRAPSITDGVTSDESGQYARAVMLFIRQRSRR